MMAQLYFGVVKVIFLHVMHLNICLQAEEKAQAERKEQTRAAEEAKTANAGNRFFCLFENLLCRDGTSNDRMVAPGLDKVIFLHVLHPNMCL